MKTIGQILKDARLSKEYSLSRVGSETKIRRDFIEAIEEERWESLPPFPTVLGFVKSLAGVLGLPEKTAAAIFKRDYPPQKLFINPKPDISSKFIWGPKLTFLAGAGITLSIIFGYLVFQYARFTSPPKIVLNSPGEGQVVDGNKLLVAGTTDTDAKILVNSQPVVVDEDGNFATELMIAKETSEIVVKSISRSGKESTVVRKITVDSK